jgi:putative SOS response-associated peptidase YedK
VWTSGIVTTDANAQAAAIHNRMPVILEQADWPLWLGELEGGGDHAALMRAAAKGFLMICPVHRDVGNVRNNHAGLLREGEPRAVQR